MYSIEDIQVFIPTYNRPEFLRQSISSLVKQSAGVPKITVFNNGTLKETSDVIMEFSEYGVQELKSTGGLLECMNNLHSFLSSAYVMIFHDDDILNRKYFEYAISALNTYKDIAFITTCTKDFTNEDEIDLSDASDKHFFFTSQEQFACYMFLYERIAMQTAIYKADLFLEFKREDNIYGKFFDWPYLVTLSGYGNTVLFCDDRIFNVRRHDGQWTCDEKSSWTVPQITKWYDQFYKAMRAFDVDSIGHMIFMAKFKTFFTGSYTGLVCQKIKDDMPFDSAIQKAINYIGIDTSDMYYDKIWVITTLQDILRENCFCSSIGLPIHIQKNISITTVLFTEIDRIKSSPPQADNDGVNIINENFHGWRKYKFYLKNIVKNILHGLGIKWESC